MLVSYSFCVVTIALTVQPQFAIECVRCSIRQGVGGSIYQNFREFPLRYDTIAEFNVDSKAEYTA